MKKNPILALNQKLFGIYTQHGGIALRILIALITLIIIAGVIVFTLSTDQEKQQLYHRKVVAISEYGLQEALQKLHDQPSWRGNIEKTSYDGGWYRVKIKRSVNADTLFLTISSESHLKSAYDSKKCILSLSVVNGDSLWIRRSMQ
jgi:hypothetical protein